jgi:hypothetical protein
VNRLRTPLASALALVLAASAVAAGCSSEFEPLETGQCLPAGAGVEGRRADAPDLVPCTQPHRYEVYARQDLDPPDDEWPGQDLVDVNAERLCALAVEEATGAPVDELPEGVKSVQIAPTEDSWSDGDREVECLFRFPEDTTDTLVTNAGQDST